VVVPPHAGQVTTDAYVPAVQPGLRVALVLMRLLQVSSALVVMSTEQCIGILGN
jgi:hypothetical protein